MAKENIIQRGAEAILILDGEQVLKRRVRKGYRIKEIDDRLRKSRTKAEAKLLEKAGKIICVPKVLKVREKEMEIDMEFIDGKKLSDWLDKLDEWKEVCFTIGKNIAALHDADLIHGDLTTSNMIYVPYESAYGGQSKGDVYFIDFGLGFHSRRAEDKAVDLYLIRNALEAKHFIRFTKYFAEVLRGYKTSKNCDLVIQQFAKVEKRGRYKLQI